MIRKLFHKLLLRNLFEPLVFQGDFQKAYYLFQFTHLSKCLINKMSKKKFSSGLFWMDQSNDSVKENISKYKKSREKEKFTNNFFSSSDEILKNEKVYYMVDRLANSGKGIENIFVKILINTSAQVGIKFKQFYTDEFHFEADINRIERKLREFNPDYLMLDDEWLKQDTEKKLHFLRQMKDELGFKLIFFLADPHYYGVEKKVSRFVGIADKLISMTSWSPLFSSEAFQSKLSYIEYFVDSKLFFPKSKEIDLFFSGLMQYQRPEIITFTAFVANKLKLKAELHVRSGNEEIRAVTNQPIIDDESYIDFMRRSKAVINSGMKSAVENGKNIHVINGRVTEAIACGAALIQYKPKDDTTLTLDNYYTPWKEYLPFSSRKELKEILYLLKYEPDIVSEIAQNGRKRYLECYGSPVNGWKNILKMPVVE